MKISISCKAPDAAAVTESGQQALPLPQLHPSPTHLTGNYSFKNEKSKKLKQGRWVTVLKCLFS